MILAQPPLVAAFAAGVVVGVIAAAILLLQTLVKPAHERERAAERALIDARSAHAAAEANVANLRQARADADSLFGAESRRLIADAQAALAVTAEARMAEVTAGLVARLDNLKGDLDALRRAREEDGARLTRDLGALGQQAKALGDALDAQRHATDRVSSLLSTSQARGTWGEFELRRLLEMTGMTSHVSFDVQQTGYGADGRGVPDVVLYIAGGGSLPIDAKVPFAAYQAAVGSADDAERERLMRDACEAFRRHVRALTQRRYHTTDGCVGWTVMFVPIEAMLSAVLAADPSVLDFAIEHRILIASPLTLLVYLYAFAQGWSYALQQESAQTILEQAHVLVSRLAPFVGHLSEVGERLRGAADAYNAAIGSFERSIAPQARRIHELGGAEALEPLAQQPIDIRRPDARRFPAASA